MAANEEFKVRCPSCGAKYKFPAEAVGRKARCAKCQATFRIVDPRGDSHRMPPPESKSKSQPQSDRAGSQRKTATSRPGGPPTEDDILRWLSEADDEADAERRTEMSASNPAPSDLPASPPTTTSPTTATPATSEDHSTPTAPRLRLHRDDSGVLDNLNIMRRVS